MQEMPPEQREELSHSQQFFIGMGIGLIPLILAMIGLGAIGASTSNILLSTALILYGLEFIATIVLLAIRRVRFIGYGLLTLFLITPVVFFIACLVRLQSPTP